MRYSVLAVFTLIMGTTAVAQSSRNYGSNTGFGNVLYPGTGHAPVVPPGGINGPSFGHRLGQNLQGNILPGRPFRAGSNRTVVVPFPVYYGPLYGGGYEQAQAPQYQEAPPIINTNTAPSVVINQTFVPDRARPVMREYSNPPEGQPEQQQQGMRLYEGPRTGSQGPMQEPDRTVRRAAPRDDLPTLYLIAFKDHSIVQALGYWVEDGNLHYVSAGHTLNQISLDLIDRDTSQQLNDERNVEFKLPR
jgi:hypothetical protein